MKILLNRICNKISGAEVYNLNLVKQLCKYDDIDIIFSSDNFELNVRMKKMNVKTLTVKTGINEIGTKKQLLSSLLKLPKYFYENIRVFKNAGNVDLIVFESMNEKILLTPILSLFNIQVVWIEHGPLFATHTTALIKCFYKFASIFVKKIICVSLSTERDLLGGGIKKTKIETIYIGIDTYEFSPLNQYQIIKKKTNLGLDKNKIISYLGSVTKEKGIVDFINIAKLLIKDYKNIFFQIIGVGELLDWTKQEVENLGISQQFLIKGFTENVKENLGISDVLLFPSHHNEGLSIALLEATAMGIPIVATDVGGNNEIIVNRYNGILYKNSSYNNVKSIIEEVISRKNVYKINARKIAIDKFSIQRNVKTFYQLFKSLAHEK